MAVDGPGIGAPRDVLEALEERSEPEPLILRLLLLLRLASDFNDRERALLGDGDEPRRSVLVVVVVVVDCKLWRRLSKDSLEKFRVKIGILFSRFLLLS